MTRQVQSGDSITADQYRTAVERRMPESTLQAQVIGACNQLGLWWLHVPPNIARCPSCKRELFRWTNPGMPDLLIPNPPVLHIWELKSETGTVRPEQQRVLDLLERCTHLDVGVKRPSDSDAIFEALAKGRFL